VGRTEAGGPYIVMEFLEGNDLSQELQRRGTLSIAEAATYAVQACAALAEAHAMGIVHRDVKPGNLFLTRRGDGSRIVKVLDFGISKVPKRDADEPSLTTADRWVGTPRYMAPEQFSGSASVDGRADVWSIGVVLYRALTGVHPFDGNDAIEVMGSVARGQLAPPSSHRPDIPEALDVVILRCLERRPVDRFASARDLAAALEPFLSTAATAAPMSVTTGGEETPALSVLQEGMQRESTLARSRANAAVAIVVSVLVIAVGISWIKWGSWPTDRAPEPEQTAAPTPTPPPQPPPVVPAAAEISQPPTTATTSTPTVTNQPPSSHVRRPAKPSATAPAALPPPPLTSPSPADKNW